MCDITVRGLTFFNVGLNIKRTCTILTESHGLLPVPKDYQEGEHFKSQRTSSFSICSIPHVSL